MLIYPELDICWLTAPAERSMAFHPAFLRVSLAVQRTLREIVPKFYFENSGNYLDLKTAYPMLVYQASRPFRGKLVSELAYDVMNPAMLPHLLRRAKPRLIELLREVSFRLNAEGQNDLAEKYLSGRSDEIVRCVEKLSKHRKWLHALVRAEGILIDALTGLGGFGSLSKRARAAKLVRFSKRWSQQLRHLYPQYDYSWLAPTLLESATEALRFSQRV
jgi:hypothetical protein